MALACIVTIIDSTPNYPRYRYPNTPNNPNHLTAFITPDHISTTFLSSLFSTTSRIQLHRRAKAERESKLKAMQARAQKGLLSEEEQAILDAELKEGARRKDDCVIA